MTNARRKPSHGSSASTSMLSLTSETSDTSYGCAEGSVQRRHLTTKPSFRLHDSVLTSGHDFYDDGYNETELDTELPNTLFGARDAFFGRDDELQTLHRVFDRMKRHSKAKHRKSNKTVIVPAAFVWGTSGSGKSRLVDTFCGQLLAGKTRRVRVLKGKFQENQEGNPFCAITQALSDWCKQLSSSHAPLTPIKEVGSAERSDETTDDDDDDLNIDARMDSHIDGHANTNANTHANTQASSSDDNEKKDQRQRHSMSHPSELQRLRTIVKSSQFTTQQKDVLTAFVPALSILFGDDESCMTPMTSASAQQSQLPQVSSTDTSWNRFQYTFTQFLTLISSRHRPVVMVLDDLQWASQECMDLMSTAIHQPHFLWIGTIRQETDPKSPGEVMDLDADLPFMRLLRDVQAQCATESPDPTATPYTNIHLQNFSQHELRDWVAQVFDQDDDVVDETTELLHKQTAGNIFHTMQLLQDMERTKALTYSRITFQWEIDPAMLSAMQRNGDTGRSSDISGGDIHAAASNVVHLVSSKLRSLPVPLQRALVLASYIRSSFELDVLQAVWDYEAQNGPTGGDILITTPHAVTSENIDNAQPEKSLVDWLEQAVLEGLLANSIGGASYRFAHDRIQQAARDLVPFGEVRTKLRLRIGQCLWDLCSTSSTPSMDDASISVDDSSIVFIAADHLNCVPSKDHLASARQNLQVGEHALQIAALVPAATYLQLANTALRKVRGDPWQDHYDLTIRLVRARCDIELSLNRFDLGYSLGHELLDHARSIHDKLPTYVAMASALGQQDEHAKGLRLAQQGAQICGEYPKRWYALHVLPQLLSIKAYLKKTTMEEFFAQNPVTKDPKTMLAMDFLRQIIIRAYSSQDMVSWALAIVRVLQITRRDGICEPSAGALNAFAMMQMTSGDSAGARRSSELAKEILRRLGSHSKSVGWVYYAAAMYIDSYSKPWDQVSQDLRYAYKSGMAVGDFELAVLSQNGNIYSSFFNGRPLTEVVPAATALLEHMEMYKIESYKGLISEMLTLYKCMQGTIELDWDTLLNVKKYDHAVPFVRGSAYWGRLYIAVYFGKFEHAETMDALFRASKIHDRAYTLVTSVAILGGVMASYRYRQTRKVKYLKMLRQRKRELKKICETQGKNGLHRYLILRAEWKAIKVGNTDPMMVETCYNKAIKQARDGNCLHEAGLACELAGEHFLRTSKSSKDDINEVDQARRIRGYFTQALGFYEIWGAVPKYEIFRNAYGSYIDEERVEDMKTRTSLVGQVKSLAFWEESQQFHSQSSTTGQDLMSEYTPGRSQSQTGTSFMSMTDMSKSPRSSTGTMQRRSTSMTGEEGGDDTALADDNLSVLTDKS